METTQIYSLVNSINSQLMGKEAMQVVDSNSFVTTGQLILNSEKLTEAFTNTLVLRITRSIISFRRYESAFKPIVYSDSRWGAIVQKLKVEMPEASEDDAYNLVEGQSIDPYIVKLPKIKQKFFVNRTPYVFYVTLQLWQLEEAFTSESAFSSLVSAIYGEVQNKIELTFEGLGRTATNNFIGNIIGTKQEVKVLSEYNTAHGTSLTPANALLDPNFLRGFIAIVNDTSNAMKAMSVLYNAEGETRHTPFRDQRFMTLGPIRSRLETEVEYAAFNNDYVKLREGITVPYWQSPEDPYGIKVTNTAGTSVEETGILGFLFDRDALGTYRKETRVASTPLNARALYINTFWHERQMWFNDLSENGVVFTLK